MSQKSLSIKSAALSDRGKHRVINEDRWVHNAQLGVYAVADGMGGHGSGDVASRLTADCIQEAFEQSAQATLSEPIDPTALVRCAIEKANSTVFAANMESTQEPGNGMGTTLVGIYLPIGDADDTITHGIVFNVGDSRLYRFRDDQLTQITEDHTLLRQWQLGEKHQPAPPGNIIMRAIGLFESVECDLTPLTVESGDLILICSDGLSDMLSDAELTNVLVHDDKQDMDSLCTELVRLANRNGGKDNITAVTLLIA